MPEGRKCKAKTKRGTPCQNFAMDNSKHCITHDPKRAKEMALKKSKSWNSHLSPEEIGPPPMSRQELVLVIAETIQHVRTNQLDPNRGKCVAELCKVAYRFMGAREVEADEHTKELGKLSDEELLKQIVAAKKELGMADA